MRQVYHPVAVAEVQRLECRRVAVIEGCDELQICACFGLVV
jgi:hypothetical protein